MPNEPQFWIHQGPAAFKGGSRWLSAWNMNWINSGTGQSYKWEAVTAQKRQEKLYTVKRHSQAQAYDTKQQQQGWPLQLVTSPVYGCPEIFTCKLIACIFINCPLEDKTQMTVTTTICRNLPNKRRNVCRLGNPILTTMNEKYCSPCNIIWCLQLSM